MATITHQASVLPSVPISGGGTQSNEFQAAIKSVTSSITVGAVFLYDTSQDSDGGAWRKKCKGLSWFDEGSSATRSARSEFPAMALIVADNVGNHPLTNTVSIYDLDDPSMPLWLQFTATSQADPYHDFWRRSKSVSAVTALNGRVYFSVGGTTDQAGVKFADFTSDRLGSYGTATSLEWSGYFSGGIADRNSDTKIFLGNTLGAIVHRNVNDVAATVLEGAEIGALGLPIPTVAVATGGGVSVIHANGDVYNQTYSFASNVSKGIMWDDNGGLYWLSSNDGNKRVLYNRHVLYATTSSSGDLIYLTPSGASTTTAKEEGPMPLGDSTPALTGLTNMGGDKWAVGGESGLSLYKNNTGNFAEGMVSYHTSSYATGYMVGDIRLAALTKTNLLTDRSVKGNNLSEVGSLNAQEVASGADNYALYGFSALNYLSISDANQGNDFDFAGADDFSIMFWMKDSSTSTLQNLMSRGSASQQTGDWLMHKDGSGKLYFYRRNGASWAEESRLSATGAIAENQWTQVVAVRRSGKFSWYVNGELSGDPATDTNAYNTTAEFVIGTAAGAATQPSTAASLSLLRISATAPTPQQIKEIYEAEKPLFQAGAKCLLYPNTSSVVQDLAYDKSTNLMYVPTSSGTSIYRGLERVEEINRDTHFGLATSGSLDFVSASGGVSAGGRITSGVGVNLPALDVRAELNEGESKLPDDGKLHFEGVTADVGAATPTVIGHIPIAENESVNVVCKVWAKKYNSTSSSYYLNGEIHQRYYKGYDSVVEAVEAASYKLIDSGAATMDVDLEEYTASDSVGIKVTGMADSRIVWKASVEVQRISEKLYER